MQVRTSRPIAWFAGALGALIVGLVVARIGWPSSTGGETGPAPALPAATFRLAILTDPKGYLEPCGCTSRPLGGIDRLAAQLAALERQGAPVVALAAGDLFFQGPTSSESQANQDRWKAETFVDVLNALDLAAVTPGKRDLAQGVPFLLSLRSRSRFPWLLAGVEAESGAAETPFEGGRLVEAGGAKVGIVGISDLAIGPESDPAVRSAVDPLEAARRDVDALRARGADVVVALVRGDRRLANRVAGLGGIEFVVSAGLDQEEPPPPTENEGAFVLHGGRQGQRLLVVDVYLRGEGAFHDASPWTRQGSRNERLREIEDLRQRIAEWERSREVSASDLAAQRRRLAELERESADRDGRPELGEGNAFVAQVIELSPEAPRDSRITAILGRYDERVNEHNRTALAHLAPPPVGPGQTGYVGSAACASCHSTQTAWWRSHPHGHAYATLERRHKEYNLDCVSCHVTGYNQPGGSTVTQNRQGALVNVGCESCHGPGEAHVADPAGANPNVVRVVPETTCTGCHNEEHSDAFDYDVYRGRIVVPGHGLPARAP